MSPGVHDGLVYVSTVPTDVTSAYNGGIAGVLWALDAKTGKKVWHFDTVPKWLWSKKHKKMNAGGGALVRALLRRRRRDVHGDRQPGAVPRRRGLPWGESRPGPNLYTDSLVKLNAKTGKLEWDYQATPHDVYDWDFQDPPILATVGRQASWRSAPARRLVVAVDAKTGKLVWKTPVGKHNGHDEDGLKAMRGEISKLPKQETV